LCVVEDIYSFVPVHGISKWYDRKGEVDEKVIRELLQHVDVKVLVSFITL